MQDIILLDSTSPERVNTSTVAAFGQVLESIAAGALLGLLAPELALSVVITAFTGGMSAFFGNQVLNGYVRSFHYKDLSTGEEFTGVYFYMSYTDAQNDVGYQFLGSLDTSLDYSNIDIAH